jgi:hypothetical protein
MIPHPRPAAQRGVAARVNSRKLRRARSRIAAIQHACASEQQNKETTAAAAAKIKRGLSTRD